MKKDVIRKISAVLFILCAIIMALEMLLSRWGFSTYRSYTNNITIVIGKVGSVIFIPDDSGAGGVTWLIFACFVCGFAAFGVSVWLKKRTVSTTSALVIVAAGLVQLFSNFFNYLQIEKGDSISLHFVSRNFVIPTLFCALSCLLLFIAVYAKKEAFVLSCCSAACAIFSGPPPLAILLWGISQRKPRVPKLAEGASAGDALEALEKLNELRQAGELSEEEFSAQKAELMKRL